MAETIKKVDGLLEVTTTGDANVSTLSREEVVGKIAEAQTKVDHLNIDIKAAEAEVAECEKWLVEIDK